ncbi:MAG TPA: DUF2203 domain-containing protein, partial [Anaerolineales bacterium]|nr:DUF2203 domain-containing protein [Anaerolineales bacterium]HNJ12774.1 DUF2203 domain-containing protein [Anaerolineales bacterium]
SSFILHPSSFILFLRFRYTPHMPKYYTLHEANQTLTIIEPMLKEMMEIAMKIRENQPELWDLVRKSAGNGGNPHLSRLLVEFDHLDALFHQLQDMGVVVKDLIIGLIDFTALHNGREVYLCWKYGEGAIQFWHEIEAGFAGRQRIDWE